MIPELGVFALAVALCLAMVQGVVPLAGAALGRDAWMNVAKPATAGQFAFVALAFACLTTSFIQNDFSVAYVVDHSNSALPLGYRVAGVWGGHEGSMLLWMLILTAWAVAVAVFSRTLPERFTARVLAVMGWISVGFLIFILYTSNPFDRQFPVPADGRDLNPLLQDPGMIAHPPMLYMGYVGFSVAFAFAIAAMLGGRLDATWARWSRPWTTVAWLFLTIGIALGSAWAYYELGWGGWWFWDPVENASFMPWLVGTALIHSLAVTEKRGAFKAWTVLLAIAAFSLSLLGTFLVRSGVLTSVHAFATDPGRGVYILVFLCVVIGGSLLLYAWRASHIRSAAEFGLFSRETLLLLNNVLLVVAAASVLLGTLYPLAVDALGLGKISVGPPYFEAVFLPPMLLLAFLIGLGPLASWKRADPKALARRLRGALAGAVALAAVAMVVWLGVAHLLLTVAIFLAAWIILSAAVSIVGRLRLRRRGWRGLTELPRGFYGMHLAHVGVAVFMLGVGVVSTMEVERNLRMAPGETAEIAGYEFTFLAVAPVEGPNYDAEQGRFLVRQAGREIAELLPEKRHYRVQRQPMTQIAIEGGWRRDLMVALGDRLQDGAWTVRLYYKPMIRWIWAGAFLMALGGALSASDRRYRLSRRRSAASLYASPA